jgi:hypothetical protein
LLAYVDSNFNFLDFWGDSFNGVAAVPEPEATPFTLAEEGTSLESVGVMERERLGMVALSLDKKVKEEIKRV